VAANILTGIGFIGAGTVFRDVRSRSGELRNGKVRGVTTAAALWASAGIGMAAGTGKYVLTLGTTLTAYILLTWFRDLEKAPVGPRGRRGNQRTKQSNADTKRGRSEDEAEDPQEASG
jgi:putative Mg2+ transporter-C (MgtC) family protein